MRWKRGEVFRKMPPCSMIQSIYVVIDGISHACPLIRLDEYAEYRRTNRRLKSQLFVFFMDWQTLPIGLHIYPTPEKAITVRVRYLPQVQEI